MEAVTSKASQIRTLIAQGGKTTREIACIVFSTENPTEANLSYVRVSGRQRGENGVSKHDIAYYANPENYKNKLAANSERNCLRWHNDMDYRNRQLAGQRRRRADRKKALTEPTNQINA